MPHGRSLASCWLRCSSRCSRSSRFTLRATIGSPSRYRRRSAARSAADVVAGRVLLQALEDDLLQVRVDPPVQHPRRRRVLVEHLPHRLDRGRARGTAAGRSGTRTGWPRGPRRRPRGRRALRPRPPAPGPCSSASRGSPRSACGCRAPVLATPKSVTLGVPSMAMQDVLRLQVPVDDAGPVDGGHGPRHVFDQFGRLAGGSGLPSSFFARLPFGQNSREKNGRPSISPIS